MTKVPRANIEWSKIPKTACIEDRGNLYVAHMGRKSAVVNWSSHDAKQAQATLWARTQTGANIKCVREIRAKRSPLPGLRGTRRKRRR